MAWDLFEVASVRFVSTEEQIARAEASLGLRFPPSYRAFCLRYGLGLIGRSLMVYVPLDDVDQEGSMTRRARVLKDRFDRNRIRCKQEDGLEVWDLWEGVDDLSVIDRAVYIGQGYDGQHIFWDARGEGEFDVYVDCRGTIRFGGRTLDAFIRRCLTDEVKAVLGPGCAPLPSLFQGWHPRSFRAG